MKPGVGYLFRLWRHSWWSQVSAYHSPVCLCRRMPLCFQNVSYQPHLPSASPPGLARRTPQLCNLTAIDSRSRRQRPGRQVTASAPAPPRPLSLNTFYNIRPMTSSDLPTVATLMKNEGWNVDFDNMAVVFHMQPDAYFVAHTTSGQVVGE